MKYQFNFNNWNNTETIDLGIIKRILTSKFSFQFHMLPVFLLILHVFGLKQL
jgi:hypothetical protein